MPPEHPRCATDRSSSPVADGRADAIIAVGADTLTDTLIKAYAQMGVFASPAFAVSEGAGAVVLEAAEIAEARGAVPYGEIVGHGLTFEALPDRRGAGIERAMLLALDEAGWRAGDIDWVWAGYTGHTTRDRSEAAAIRRVFGPRLRVFSPKRMLGEAMGVGGLISLVLAVTGGAHRVLVNSSSLGGSHFSIALTSFGRTSAGHGEAA
jgi:3-oxoacyl-[acyl-carrier-protein] synthase II